MSKERLEEIKEKYNYERLGEFIDAKLVNPYELKWLIAQAERVQELGEDLLELVKQNKELRKSIAFYSSESYNAHLERLLDRSEKQIKRYREALEFYANRQAYYHTNEHQAEIMLDYGNRARKALEGEE